MKRLLGLLLVLAAAGALHPRVADAQQQQILCNVLAGSPCNPVTNPGNGNQGMPAWQFNGITNNNFNQLFGMWPGGPGLLYSNGPPPLQMTPLQPGTLGTYCLQWVGLPAPPLLVGCPGGSGGTPPAPFYGVGYNNDGVWASLLPASSGIYCLQWASIYAPPVLISCPGGGGGSGTVTQVSIVSANGLTGSVSNPTTTPSITLAPNFSGIAYSNGFGFSTATAGDFPTLNQSTTGNAATATALAATPPPCSLQFVMGIDAQGNPTCSSLGTGVYTFLTTPTAANLGAAVTGAGLIAGANVTITGAWPNQTISSTASGGGVTSFTGDGALLSNTGSAGAVTATLANTGVGYGVWGNLGAGSGPPGYHVLSSYPVAAFPTLNQNTTGNAATATSAITATNLAAAGTAGYPYLSNGGSAPGFGQLNLGGAGVTGTLPNADLAAAAPAYGLGYNNNGPWASLLPSTAGTYCPSWSSLSAPPTLITCPGSGGGLTSVGLSSSAAWLTIGNSPLTVNGTLTISATTGLTTHEVLGTGTIGTVSLIALTDADLPTIPSTQITGLGTFATQNYATPPIIGATTPNTGWFTTLNVSGTITSTVATGNPPFTVSSTTNVANLNASSLNGATFASPGPIGNTAPGTGAFSNLSATGTVSGTGFQTYLANPPAIGGTTPSSGAFTTLSATSTVSGAGFTAYMASPPAIGGTTAAAGTFAALTTTGGMTNSKSGASVTSAEIWTGTPYSGGTGGSTYPLIYADTGTGPTTWSTNGTYFGINTASLYTGNFMDFHVNGGSSVFSINYQGNVLGGTYNGTTIPTSQTLLYSGSPAGTPSSINLANGTNLPVAGLQSDVTTVNGQSCALAGTCSIPFQTNSTNNASLAGINFETSTTNAVGLTVTPVNSGTNVVKMEVSGGSYTGNAAGLSGSPTNGEFWGYNGTAQGWYTPTAAASSITIGTTTVSSGSPPCLVDNPSGTSMGCGTIGSGLSLASGTLAAFGGQLTYSVASQSLVCTTVNSNLLTNTYSGGAATWTLPAATTTGCGAGFSVDIYNASSSTLTVTSSVNIGPSTTLTIPASGSCSLTTDNGGATYDLGICPAVYGGGGGVSASNPNTWTALQTYDNNDIALLGSSTGYTIFSSANGSSTNYTVTVPANTGTIDETNLAQTFTAVKTFTNSALCLLGSSTGCTTVTSANSSATNYTLTVPANTGTMAELNIAQTFTAAQAFSGGVLNSLAGSASVAAVLYSGAPYTGGSGTTTYPLQYMDTTGATAPTTWNTNGTFFGVNTASGYTGNFLDFHVNGGASLFSLNYQGNVTGGTYNGTTIPTSQTLIYSGGPGGTPSSINLSNGTSLPVAGITGLGTFATQNYATPPAIGSTTPASGAFTTLTNTGAAQNTAAGAASTPAKLFSGAPYTSGTATTNVPLVYINDGTGPTSWSTAGTEFGMNAPSGFAGNFIDFHLNGGSSLFSVNYQGVITGTGTGLTGTATSLNIGGNAATATGLSTTGGNGTFWGVSSGVQGWYTPAGSGTVNSSTAGYAAYYASSGTAVSGASNIVISPTGIAMSATGSASNYTMLITGSSTTGDSEGLDIAAGTGAADNAILITNQAGTEDFFGIKGNGSGYLGYTGSTSALTWNTLGDITITAQSGNAFTVVGATSNNEAVLVDGNTTTGQSKGVYIIAGTNSSDYALNVQSSAAAQLMEVFGDGGITIGSPTGGDKGAGSLNMQSCYINGVACGGGGGGVTIGNAVSGGTANTLLYTNSSTDVANASSVPLGFTTTPIALTAVSGNFTPNLSGASSSNQFTLTLGSGDTVANPTGPIAGEQFTLAISQPASGGPYTVSWGAGYAWAMGSAPTLATAASAVTIVSCQVLTTTPTMECYGPLNSAFLASTTAANPTGPASTSAFQAQGLSSGVTQFTPTTTGNMKFTITGTIENASGTIDVGLKYYIMYGTGNGNANGSTTLGTTCGPTQTYTNPVTETAADINVPFSINCTASGLTIGTAYYIDLAAEAVTTASEAKLTSVSMSANEVR